MSTSDDRTSDDRTSDDRKKAWTPGEIKDLRKRLGMTQTELGTELYEAKPSVAQVNVSRLERGGCQGKGDGFGRASSAVRRTLRRLEENLDKQKKND